MSFIRENGFNGTKDVRNSDTGDTVGMNVFPDRTARISLKSRNIWAWIDIPVEDFQFLLDGMQKRLEEVCPVANGGIDTG